MYTYDDEIQDRAFYEMDHTSLVGSELHGLDVLEDLVGEHVDRAPVYDERDAVYLVLQGGVLFVPGRVRRDGHRGVELEGMKEVFYLTTHSTHFYLRLYGVGHTVRKEGSVLFNDALNTFLFTVIWRWTYGKEGRKYFI